MGSAAISSPGAPSWMASRISCMAGNVLAGNRPLHQGVGPASGHAAPPRDRPRRAVCCTGHRERQLCSHRAGAGPRGPAPGDSAGRTQEDDAARGPAACGTCDPDRGNARGGRVSMASETPNRGGESTQADGRAAEGTTGSGRGYHVEIFLICLASLLLGSSYTRIVSFKLFYYFPYLVIELALLGIGTGSVVVSLSKSLKRASTAAIVTVGSLVGAAFVFVGYIVVARLSVASLAVWDYGSGDSYWNTGMILVLCLALFASFVPIGVMISTLFSRRTEGINKLYFADLVGAGVACAVVVFLMNGIGPARTIMLAGAVLAAVALRLALADQDQVTAVLSGVATVGLVVLTVAPSLPGPLGVDPL